MIIIMTHYKRSTYWCENSNRNTALITKSIFLNNNIENLLFKFLQTNISNCSAILCCVHKCNQWSLYFISSLFCKNKYWTKQYICIYIVGLDIYIVYIYIGWELWCLTPFFTIFHLEYRLKCCSLKLLVPRFTRMNTNLTQTIHVGPPEYNTTSIHLSLIFLSRV